MPSSLHRCISVIIYKCKKQRCLRTLFTDFICLQVLSCISLFHIVYCSRLFNHVFMILMKLSEIPSMSAAALLLPSPWSSGPTHCFLLSLQILAHQSKWCSTHIPPRSPPSLHQSGVTLIPFPLPAWAQRFNSTLWKKCSCYLCEYIIQASHSSLSGTFSIFPPSSWLFLILCLPLLIIMFPPIQMSFK